MSESVTQEQIHGAIAELLADEGEVLTGWVIAYETQVVGESPNAGHFYGPEGMTNWRALGLIEWVRQVTLPDSLRSDEDGD